MARASPHTYTHTHTHTHKARAECTEPRRRPSWCQTWHLKSASPLVPVRGSVRGLVRGVRGLVHLLVSNMGLENRPSSSSLRKNARRLQERETVSGRTSERASKREREREREIERERARARESCAKAHTALSNFSLRYVRGSVRGLVRGLAALGFRRLPHLASLVRAIRHDKFSLAHALRHVRHALV